MSGPLACAAWELVDLTGPAKIGALMALLPAATQCGDRHVSLRLVIEAIIP
jgi:hypothetical protein